MIANLTLKAQSPEDILEVDGIYHLGLIEAWNEAHPDEDVRIGDKVVEVNREVDATLLRKTLLAKQVLQIVFERHLHDSLRELNVYLMPSVVHISFM